MIRFYSSAAVTSHRAHREDKRGTLRVEYLIPSPNLSRRERKNLRATQRISELVAHSVGEGS